MSRTIKKNHAIAQFLKNNRRDVANIFAQALNEAPSWKDKIESSKDSWEAFLEEEFFAYADYLALYFEESDNTFLNLFIGEKIKSLYDINLNISERKELADSVFNLERTALEEQFKTQLGGDWDAFIAELSYVHGLLTSLPPKQPRVVFVGDCIFLDIIPFITAPLIENGISIYTDFIASKNPAEARESLKKLSSEKIDLVFYSPFTYEYNLNLNFFQTQKNAFASRQQMDEHLESAWDETQTTIKLISDFFDCPIYIHNATLVIRHDNPIKHRYKHILTKRIRRYASEWLNQKLPAYIDSINNSSFKHLFLFDEKQQLGNLTEFEASKLIYKGYLQHPSALGKEISKHYVDIIYTHCYIHKKKLVVSDLDNTLWDGVIGEGAVSHFHDRQTILMNLRERGIVLAILSKNDEKNVHWTDATLSPNDFVYEAINWQPKVQNMAAIPGELNLKINSFIFIDDREDELELMRETYPDVLCLDAKDPKSWERLSIWSKSLEDNQEMDRTLMYQQREERKEFLKESVTSDEDKMKMFSSLALQLSIKKPAANEVKRVTELINRTNQFNLEGTRVSLKEMTEWHDDSNYIMLSARTADRFGDMGVTCVTVGKLVNTEFQIIAFVLSCRVFGYQFEHSVMNHLKQLAKGIGAQSMRGKYTATAVNAPCKDFLTDNGFKEEGEYSYFDLNNESRPDAAWITMKIE